jgi:beta-lactamase regulating signal transducer with metallopeptidase domain
MNVLLQWLVGGLVIATVATLIVRLVPASSPAQRHAFWWLALAGVLVMPWAPALFLRDGAATPLLDPPVAPAAVAALTVPPPPDWLAMSAVFVWALFSVVSLARLAINLRAVRRLAVVARPLAPEQGGRFHRFVAARAGSRPTRVCVSAEISGACAVGFLRPRILVSTDLVATLDDDALEAIVLHEYAHLQRFDDWTRLLQRAVLAFAGLHPAVRWISRQIDIEREMACDRLVVDRTGEPVAYARSLTAAAEVSSRMNGLTPTAVPGASMSGGGLHARVTHLLSGTTSRGAGRTASLVSAATLGITLTAAASMPPIVALTTLQLPLPALDSAPLRAAFVRELPDASHGARGAAPIISAGAQRQPSRRDDGGTIADDAERSSSGGDVFPAPAGVDAMAVAAAPSATILEPLPSSALLPQLSVAPPPALEAGDSTSVPGDGGIGAAATRAGVATADVAARAGTSVGRFFRNGGSAIARRF